MTRTVFLSLLWIPVPVWAGTPVTLEKAGDLVARYGEKTCEGTYYGVFAPPAARKALDEKKDFDRASKIFEDIKAVIGKSAALAKIREKHPTIAEEFVSRLKHARFTESGTEGAFARFVEGEGDDLGQKDLLGEPLRKIVKGDRVTDTPTVLWKAGASTPATDAGKAFFLGHEATHLINWAPADVVACLTDEKAYAARRRIDPKGLTPAQQAFHALVNDRLSPSKLEPKELAEIEKDANEAKALIKTCTPKRSSGLELDRRFFFEEFDREMRLDLEKMLREPSPRIRELIEELRRDAEKKKKDEKPKMDQRSGWGTAPFVLFESCLKTDSATALKLFTLVKKYRLPGLPGERFEDQTIEAVADFYGVEFVVEWIQTQVARGDQRAAALGVLAAMAPVFYPTDAREILDYVSSKKTNEARVLGLLLAHPEFRKLLGCELKAKGPRYCGE